MDKFITESIVPLLPQGLDETTKEEKLALVQSDFKIFLNHQIKIETSAINKEMAKKSRQLFILSSDIEQLKQNIEGLQGQLQTTKNQLANLDSEKSKQKLVYEKKISNLEKQSEETKQKLKRQLKQIKDEKEYMQETNKQKIRQLKKGFQITLTQAIEKQKNMQQENEQTLRKQFDEQRNFLVKQNSEKKKELIRRYEQKLVKNNNDNENKIKQIDKVNEGKKNEWKETKYRLQTKMSQLENDLSRTQSQLLKETGNHKKYKGLYDEAYQQLSGHQQKTLKIQSALESELHETKEKLSNEEREHTKNVKNLTKKLEDTIEQKDSKLTNTIQLMNIQRTVQVDSLRNQMMEEREIAVNKVETTRDQENYQHEQRFSKLSFEYEKLKSDYNNVSSDYENRIRTMEEDQEDFISGLNTRKQYELAVAKKNEEREFNSLLTKYELQIKSLHLEHAQEVKDNQKKFNEDKIALSNKMTTRYEQMLADQKNSSQIQLKQKLIEFDRKAKSYENRIKEGDKKKNELKAGTEKVKMQMQMRIDALMDKIERCEGEISNLYSKVRDNDRQKSLIINQYQLKLLKLRNEMKELREEYEERQSDLKQVCESKIIAKNTEITNLITKLKRETQDLIDKHNKRLKALQKQYNELKRVVGQKTSLPEDIQALKIFHDAYLQKQQQLKKSSKKIGLLQRELLSKDAMDKVFAEKAYSFRTSKILSFRSNQL